jgi:photosystem II stability/assembly factor-like uncharacterized protein
MSATLRPALRLGLIMSLALFCGALWGQDWAELGPAPIGDYRTTGRVSAIVADPEDPDAYWVGGADGGVWRTLDGGLSWTPVTDEMPTTAIGALAYDPANDDPFRPPILYAGSGEANFANHSRYGMGIYRSKYGGMLSEVCGYDVFAGRCISRVLINPAAPSILYISVTHAGGLPSFDFNIAGAKGHPGAYGPLGVFMSTDSGDTWTQLTNGLPGDLSATDIAMDPLNPNVLYAAIGHVFGDSRNGIYRSTNGGAVWTKLAGGLPAGGGVGRITLGTTPADPNRIYASIVRAADATGGGSSTLAVYRSDDGGITWVPKYPGSIHSSYGWYLNTLVVSPLDPDIVFTAGLELWRTMDGGDHWTNVQGIQHVDFHALAWDAGGRLLTGNDGGFYRSSDLGETWTILNEGLGIVQFYAGISLHPSDPTIIYGGTQDNGTIERIGAGLDSWRSILGGDGGYTGVRPSNPNIVFAEYQGTGGLQRSTNGGNSFSYAGTGINSGDRNCFLPAYEFDLLTDTRMFYGTHRLYRSTNGGTQWSAISGDLTTGVGAIRGLAVAPSDPNFIYVGTNDGNIQVSQDGGASWFLALTGVPGWPRTQHQFAVHPRNPYEAYLAVAYFGVDQILRSANGGAVWKTIDGDLPDVPVNTVALDARLDPAVIYLGTDRGVYRSFDIGEHWLPYGYGLPNCAAIDLRVDVTNNRLVAATQGRGMWEIEITEPSGYQSPEKLLHMGWGFFSLPSQPENPYPYAILGTQIPWTLVAWDHIDKTWLLAPWDFEFLEVGRGYGLWAGSDNIGASYVGTPVTGDFEIAVPEAGHILLGVPTLTPILQEDLLIRDDETGVVRMVREDDASPEPWMNWNFTFWDNYLRTARTLIYDGSGDDTYIRPWYAYWAWSNRRDLTLIVPDL